MGGAEADVALINGICFSAFALISIMRILFAITILPFPPTKCSSRTPGDSCSPCPQTIKPMVQRKTYRLVGKIKVIAPPCTKSSPTPMRRDYSKPVGLKGVSLVGTKHRIWQRIGNDFSYGNKNVRINEEI